MTEKEIKTGTTTGIGPRIRRWRKAVPMKAFQLAALIRVSQGSLSDIENDKSAPSAQTIVNLLTLTDIDWRWVLTGVLGDIPEGTKPENISPLKVILIAPGEEFIVRGK